MFAEWELIGIPHRLTVGERGLKEGSVEYQNRKQPESEKWPEAEVVTQICTRLAK